jgi:hypothetical protein
MFITNGGILPPHSDSLSYQVYALNAVKAIASNSLSFHEFIYGNTYESIPPLYKFFLMFSYMLGGIVSGSEYVANYFLVIISGVYLGLISLLVYQNKHLFYLTLIAFITLNGISLFSLFDTRNDTLAITLYIIGVYYLFKSNFFIHRRESIVVAVAISSALLTKSAFAGYILLPFVLILSIIVVNNERSVRFKNLLVTFVIVICLISFYYIPKYSAILDYYSFWSKELSSVVYEQYNIKSFIDRLMFYPISTFNHFGYTIYIFLPFIIISIFRLNTKEIFFGQMNNKPIIALIGFSFLPYIILILNGSFSIVADLYMVPFLLVILIGFLSKIKHIVILDIIFAIFIAIGMNTIVKHYQNPVENNLDYKKFSSELHSVLTQNKVKDKKIYLLFYDLGLNDKTIEYLHVKDTLLRTKSNIEASNISYKYRVNPKLSSDEIYQHVKANSDIVLIANQKKGPSRMKINQEWDALYKTIRQDEDFRLIGTIKAYFDGTEVAVYVKNNVIYELTQDGWLLNGASISINSNKGKFKLYIKDTYNYYEIKQLEIEDSNHEKSYCRIIQDEQSKYIECLLNKEEGISHYKLRSDKPLIPSLVNKSLDTRELLFFKPEFLVERR